MSVAPQQDKRQIELLRAELREAKVRAARSEAKLVESASVATTLKVELEKLRNQRELDQKARLIDAEVRAPSPHPALRACAQMC